jgi:hypothetical protein
VEGEQRAAVHQRSEQNKSVEIRFDKQNLEMRQQQHALRWSLSRWWW